MPPKRIPVPAPPSRLHQKGNLNLNLKLIPEPEIDSPSIPRRGT